MNDRDRLTLHLERGQGQDPPIAVAQLAGRTYRLTQVGTRWKVAGAAAAREPTLAKVPVLAGYRLSDVAPQVGLDFRQGMPAGGMVRVLLQALLIVALRLGGVSHAVVAFA